MHTALEEDEIAAYLKAANTAMPDGEGNAGALFRRIRRRLRRKAGESAQIWALPVSNMPDPRSQKPARAYAAKGIDALPAQYKGPPTTTVCRQWLCSGVLCEHRPAQVQEPADADLAGMT